MTYKHDSSSHLEQYFQKYRANIIGNNQLFKTQYGLKQMIYADWTASGRLYHPIEAKIAYELGPYFGNTHTDSTITSKTTSAVFEAAERMIKDHVQASENDALICTGAGMTSAVNKLQRLLGIRAPANLQKQLPLTEKDRPIIFISHMEHHSNYLSWVETIGDVVMVPPDHNGLIDLDKLEQLLNKYADRKLKIGAFTACSNVTGIETPFHHLAKIMHQHGGFCFIDFAASAPYIDINMHPEDPAEKLDAIYFSPHKFLGGPGATGILIVDQSLIVNHTPDHPGGGTVLWTDYWGDYSYTKDLEAKENGGTPGIIQTIKAALAIKLKESMGTEMIQKREEEMLEYFLPKLDSIDRINILGPVSYPRLGTISFYAQGIHHHLFAKVLNDHFGIQARGGCSCAGPYGHYLLGIPPSYSEIMAEKIEHGDLSLKPGWVRISLHPTMTNAELQLILFAVEATVKNIEKWRGDYLYQPDKDNFVHKHSPKDSEISIDHLFSL